MATRTRPRRRGGRTTTTTTTTTSPATTGTAPVTGPAGGTGSGGAWVWTGEGCTLADGSKGALLRNTVTGATQCVPGTANLSNLGDVPGYLGGIVTGWVGDLLRGLIPILKVGAGGVGLLVSAIALVYVAGRNVPGAPAVTATRKAVRTVSVPARVLQRKRSTVSDAEYFERRGMERAARQAGRTETSYRGLGERLPRKQRSAA